MRIGNETAQNALTSMQVQKSKAEDASFKSKLANAVSEQDKQKLREVCQDFEAVLLNMMMQTMRKTVPKSDLLGHSQGKEIFESLLDQEITKDMAKAGGVGLADLLFKQLSSSDIAPKAKSAGQ